MCYPELIVSYSPIHYRITVILQNEPISFTDHDLEVTKIDLFDNTY